jgi:DUF1680 family protein
MHRLYGDAVLSARRSAQRPSEHPQLFQARSLNIFYERIVGAADDFAEAYQGRHGLIGPISLMSAKKTANIIEFLEDQLKEIEACRYEVVDKSDSSLQQLIDNIVEVYLRTLYKLRFLA